MLDEYVTHAALLAVRIFLRMDGSSKERLDLREKIRGWKLRLDVEDPKVSVCVLRPHGY